MKNKIVIIGIVTAFTLGFAAYSANAQIQNKKGNTVKENQEKTLKKAHEDLQCFDCHMEEKPTSSLKVSCVNCHGTPEDVAKLTESKFKEHYNPHNSLHYGTNALCENCHREHTVSKLECNNPLCHTEFKYQTP